MENNTQEKIVGYQAFYLDASSHAQFEIINIEYKQNYVTTFQDKIPIEKEYKNWKKKHNIGVIESKNVKDVGGDGTREGYKFTKSCGKEIYDYLNTRPMIEVETMIFAMFENPKDPDPFMSREGIQTLTKYLQEVCPRIEAKHIIELMANGGLEKYVLKPTKPEKKSKKSEEKS